MTDDTPDTSIPGHGHAMSTPGEADLPRLDAEHRAVEAVLLSAVEPVQEQILAELLEVSGSRVQQICEDLRLSYETGGHGFVLARVAGGYRLQTHPEMAAYVERFALEGVSSRLSSAALETLAIVAYRQPVSRAQIAALRGVNADGVVRMLVQRGYIEAVGQATGPGQATLYGTTTTFLERLGLDSIADLPPAEDLLPDAPAADQLELGLRPETAP